MLETQQTNHYRYSESFPLCKEDKKFELRLMRHTKAIAVPVRKLSVYLQLFSQANNGKITTFTGVPLF